MMKEGTLLQNPALLVKALVTCLNQLVSETPSSGSSSVFDLKTAPTISVGDYIARSYFLTLGMVKYMNASLSVYIYSLLLLDRVQEYNP